MDETNITTTTTDKALGWDNPYVCVTFFCRICNLEQAQDEEEWQKHFNSHIINPPQVNFILFLTFFFSSLLFSPLCFLVKTVQKQKFLCTQKFNLQHLQHFFIYFFQLVIFRTSKQKRQTKRNNVLKYAQTQMCHGSRRLIV